LKVLLDDNGTRNTALLQFQTVASSYDA